MNQSQTSPQARRSHAVFLAPVLLLAAVIYARALGTFFAQDDITFLSRAAGLEPWNGVYRPLSEGLAFRIEYAMFGLDPFGYHVVNLLLHLLNIAGVYALGARLGASRAVAGAATVLFGASSIAFTPLHWASGLVELLPCTFLLGATLLQFESQRRGWIWCWAAALVALAAMLMKETAVTWFLVVALIELRSGRGVSRARAVLPAAAVTGAFAIFFILTGQAQGFEHSEAYAISASPWFLAANLFTYLRWCVALNDPVRDLVAAADPRAWLVGVPLAMLLVLALWLRRRAGRHPMEVATGWWLAFLLPVLPLAHHTYLYYLYIPWVGGAISVAAIGQAMFAPFARQRALFISLIALGLYVLIEAHNVAVRESATRDALPVDRTMRDATLLSHALPALRKAALGSGTRVAFVNPVPRPRLDLMSGAPTRPEDLPYRTSYMPLEAAMRQGETLRLFLPGIMYLGFANTIPPSWEDAECFYYEQRGWLEYLGHGQRALLRQAEIQMAAGRWAAAESTFLRVRALGDTLPTAVEGEATALFESGRTNEARASAAEFLRRWPAHPHSGGVRSLLARAPAGTP